MTKRLLLATVSSLVLAGAASAADMAARAPMYTKAPPVAVPAWAGFYLGVNGGFARLNMEHTDVDDVATCSGAGTTCDLNANGGVFGGQVGYNFQSGAWVYGLEADMDWASLKKDRDPTSISTLRAEIDALGSFRARFGFVEGNTLFYATGGLAVGHLKSGWGNGYLGSGPFAATGCCDDQLSKWKAGWVIGGGIERKVSPNWLVRVETLYYNLGRSDSAFFNVGTGDTYRTQFKHEVFVSRLGVSYKW